MFGHIDCMLLLLNAGACISSPDLGGLSVLHIASEKGQLPAVQLLIERGADLSARDSIGRTPRDWAESKGHVAVWRALEEWELRRHHRPTAAGASSAAEIIEGRIAEILTLYRVHGEADYIGEPVSQLSHMTQAAMLAEKFCPSDSELVLAAFLHDIGQLLSIDARSRLSSTPKRIASSEIEAAAEAKAEAEATYGARDHEHVGADFLASRGFSDRVVALVRNHVSAKRYLCAVDAEYHSKLSAASRVTLVQQGGPMCRTEASQYSADPDCALYCRLRMWDDEAKLATVAEQWPLAHFEKRIREHLFSSHSHLRSGPAR
jgi:predicted HD phosphohydrolase